MRIFRKVTNESEKEQLCGDIEENFDVEIDGRRETVALNACKCFGWDKDKTDKWLIGCAKIWYALASLMWFVFSAVSFAPVIFITDKVNVIFKNKRMAFLCSIAIYVILIALILTLIFIRKVPDSL